jgi:isopenicillin-N N-acyltransferase like protein
MNPTPPDITSPIHPEAPPIIHVGGSHYEIGEQIGKARPQQIHNSIHNARKLIEEAYDSLELTWEGAQIQAQKYMPFAQERYPQYIDELQGIADGADVPFEELSVVNALEAVTMDALHLSKCSSFAVNGEITTDEHVLVAHNEDWTPEDEADVYLVNAAPDDEPAFLAMTYGGLLPNIGFNAAGIAQCCDTVYPNDSRIGLPRVVLSRAILGARNLVDAVRLALAPQRAAGYNHLLVDENGEMLSVEVAARRFAIIPAYEGYLAHTNHYLDPKMQAIEKDPDELIVTRLRYFRIMRLLKNQASHSIKSLKAIQRDHLNYPDSICNHCSQDSNPLDREKTINSLIMDLTTRAMHIAWGNPCVNQYHTFYLKE